MSISYAGGSFFRCMNISRCRLGPSSTSIQSPPVCRASTYSSSGGGGKVIIHRPCRQFFTSVSTRTDQYSTQPLMSRISPGRGRQEMTFAFAHGKRRSGRRPYKTMQEQKSRYRSGPFSWKSGAVFLLTGIGLIIYFRMEKARMERKRITEATKGIGKPKVGGPFQLIDHHGRPFTDQDLRGKYSLVYFGFTHCPDICPEELDKMAEMIDLVKSKFGPTSTTTVNTRDGGGILRPIFISCDPARDSPAVIKSYLAEFHADLIGLTGDYEAVKAVCKAYRVYFSTPEHVRAGQDYLVDHSIYFYLMDPEGDFVECIGRQHSARDGAKIIIDHIGDWKGPMNQS